MADFEVSYVIVCDDVRKEITGKDILIGVYASGINVPQLPTIINLAFWLEFIPKRKGNIEVDIKAEAPNQAILHQLRMLLIVENTSHNVAVATPAASFVLQKEGEIRVSVKPPDAEKWKLAKRIKITQGPRKIHLAVPPAGPPG